VNDFEERLATLEPDLHDTVSRVYGAEAAPEVTQALVEVARAAHAARPAELRALDEQRLRDPDWFQRPSMVGYAAYADRFAGTLRGVGERAAYLRGLGVGYLHLMPLLTPRPAPNDGGYAVMDYRSVRSDLGTVDDLRDLATTLRGEGISLCLDLVLNHVAREHEWAVAARAGDEGKRAYFHVHPDREVPDAYEATLPEVFPDFAPGNFTFDDELDAWVWTTFNDYQWDLDWSNPAVLCEFADIILALANVGVEVFRLDAIAFLWKRLGTDCQNQPEVHELTRALRTVARIAAPAVLFKAEAIVGPADLPAYLGVGEHAGKVMAGADAAYDYTPFFWSDILDAGYEAVGETSSELDMVEDWKDGEIGTGVVYYVGSGQVRGVLLWNVWDSVDQARELIAETGKEPVTDLESLRGRIAFG
jgi:amylosucrase